MPTRTASDDKPRESIGTFFLDSGAHSLYTKEVILKAGQEKGAYYESDAFWSYVDSYAEFVKAHLDAIDYYVNVDVIFNPKISWRVLKYLEKDHGLKPLPVIHWGTSMEWIKKHLDAGYEFIGLGGLGQEVTKDQYYDWADRVYSLICPGKDKLPIVRTHGFAMTAWELMFRYPWWSVDSASWVKAGGFGMVYVPRKVKGKFDFTNPMGPYNIPVSNDSPAIINGKRHFVGLTEGEQKVVSEWLEQIDIPFGSSRPIKVRDKDTGKMVTKQEMIEWGVCSHHGARKIANLRFFEAMVAALPKWPWAFKYGVTGRKGFFDL